MAYMGFKKLSKALAKNPKIDNPGAVAASIGREKYGAEKFQKAASEGKKMEHMDRSPNALSNQKKRK